MCYRVRFDQTDIQLVLDLFQNKTKQETEDADDDGDAPIWDQSTPIQEKQILNHFAGFYFSSVNIQKHCQCNYIFKMA